jgi:hypothetical protein
MKMKSMLLAAVIAVILTAVSANARVTVIENFSGKNELNGTVADTFSSNITAAGGSATWVADSGFGRDGTVSIDRKAAYLNLGSYINNAKGTSDGLFTLTMTLSETTGTWLSLGFAQENTPSTERNFTNGTAVSPAPTLTTNGLGTIIYRAQTASPAGELDMYGGAGSANAVDGPDGNTGSRTLTVTLDLTPAGGTYGKVTWSDSVLGVIGSYTYTTNRNFGSILITGADSSAGVIDNLTLSRNGTVIVIEDFDDSSGSGLFGTLADTFSPDITAAGGSATWAANSGFGNNGSVSVDRKATYLNLGSYINDAKGTSDGLFELTVTMSETTGSWLSLGFAQENTPNTDKNFTNTGTGTATTYGLGTIIYRAQTASPAGELDMFGGPGNQNVVDGPDGNTGSRTLTVTLDLTPAGGYNGSTNFGKVTWSDSVLGILGSYTYTTNRNFGSILISGAESSAGFIRGLTLSRVSSVEVSLSPFFNSGDGTYTTSTRESQQVWIPNSYLYFQLPSDFPTGTPAYVEITYYDELTGPRLGFQFDSASSAYTSPKFHTRSSGEGSMAFVKSYHRLDKPLFANRQTGGADFRINAPAFPIKSVIVRDWPFTDPLAAYVLAVTPPWLLPYVGPSYDDVYAYTTKGKLITGYQGWFRTPNDMYDGGFDHWGVQPDGNSTVDQWPDPADYDPASLHLVPGFTTVGGKPGYVFSSGDRDVVQTHFEWMRKYNIDGVHVSRFFANSAAGANPEWVLAAMREAAHLSGRVWMIVYDVTGGTDANLYNRITTDWKWLVDQVGITRDSRYLREGGKPVVAVWGAACREGITQGPMNDLVDFLKSDPVYGGNYVVGGVSAQFPSEWDDHFARYHSIYAWMASETAVRDHAAQFGINAQVHVWPGFSWHNLNQLVYPNQYTDRAGGDFLWGKIYNGINIISPETVLLGMFDEYNEGTAVMPMSDDPPVVPHPEIYGHYITNDGWPKDWWMMLSGYGKEMLCKQVPLSSTKPTLASLANRSNIGQEMSVKLGATNINNGIVQENPGDGPTVSSAIDGVTCRRATNLYMYFDVDDAILYQAAGGGADVTIIVDYYDASGGVTIGLHYDSVYNQWKTHPKSFTTSGTNRWETARFEINDAYFGNRESGADFRLVSNTVYNMNIARVRVILPEQAPAPAPVFVAAGAVASGTGTITPALPTGRATNDILLLFIETSNQAVSISNQNGGTWTAVTNSPQYCGTAASTTGARLTAFWSRYNGTQGAPTVSDSGDHQLARIIAIRGAVTSGNPWDVTAGGVEAVSDTSGSIVGATTTVANTLVVTAIATSLPDESSTAKFSAWTNANLTSLTERTDNSVTAGNGGGLAIATGIKATAGAYGNTAVTLANAAYKGMMSIAIKP